MEWTTKKTNLPSVMISLEYDDFATVEVEKKKMKNSSLMQYVISVEIKDLFCESFIIDDFQEVEKALKEIKTQIEILYDNLDEYDEEDLNDWCEVFSDTIQEF